MIEWIKSLSTAETWLYGIIAAFFIAWFSQRLSHALALKRELRKNLIPASAEFRSSINIEAINGLKGHQLHNALIREATIIDGHKIEGEYFKHKRAVKEYRFYLGWLEKRQFNKAWEDYHGGDEDHPDFFKLYCVPSDGPELLKERLRELRKFGEKR